MALCVSRSDIETTSSFSTLVVNLFFRLTILCVFLYTATISYAIRFEDNNIKYETIGLELAVQVTGVPLSSDIVIPDIVYYEDKAYTVKAIKNNAFFENKALYSVVLPESVISIGNKAFANCKNLTTVQLPSHLESLGRNAFAECTSLSNINTLGRITVLNNSTFLNCKSLSSVQLPETLESIEDKAFYACAIKNISLPDRITKLGALAFANCVLLEDIRMGSGLTSIGSQCFCNCISLDNVRLSNRLTVIPDNCFQDCSALKNITLPESLQRIGRSAFLRCNSIIFLRIPANVMSIGDKFIDECSSMDSISVERGNSVYSSGSGMLLAHNGEKLVRCPEGKQISTAVPGTVREISAKAFEGCSQLQGIAMSPKVESIGERAFAGCSSLKGMALPAGLKYLGEKAFFQCSSLEQVAFEDPASDSKNPYFQTYGEQVGLYDGQFIESILSLTFAECPKLQVVKLPSTIKSLSDDAFYDCKSLYEIHIRALNPPTIFKLSNTRSSRHITVVVMPHRGDLYKKATGWNRYTIEELIDLDEYIESKQKEIDAQRAKELEKQAKKDAKVSREEKKLLRNQRRNEKIAERAREKEERAREKEKRAREKAEKERQRMRANR